MRDPVFVVLVALADEAEALVEPLQVDLRADLDRHALTRAMHKLPMKCRIVRRDDTLED